MARTYPVNSLYGNDTTSADWALAMTRLILRDIPNDNDAYPNGSLQDQEISTHLEATKVQDAGGDNTVYYFPHHVAALLVSANPEWRSRWSAAGYSETLRSASDVARNIRASYAWINSLIMNTTNGRVGGRSLRLRL